METHPSKQDALILESRTAKPKITINPTLFNVYLNGRKGLTLADIDIFLEKNYG